MRPTKRARGTGRKSKGVALLPCSLLNDLIETTNLLSGDKHTASRSTTNHHATTHSKRTTKLIVGRDSDQRSHARYTEHIFKHSTPNSNITNLGHTGLRAIRNLHHNVSSKRTGVINLSATGLRSTCVEDSPRRRCLLGERVVDLHRYHVDSKAWMVELLMHSERSLTRQSVKRTN